MASCGLVCVGFAGVRLLIVLCTVIIVFVYMVVSGCLLCLMLWFIVWLIVVGSFCGYGWWLLYGMAWLIACWVFVLLETGVCVSFLIVYV